MPDDGVARRSGAELLDALLDTTCPYPRCEGSLEREEYKDTPALVCRSCEIPVVRIWGTSHGDPTLERPS